jgi:DnaJ-class molecular chaperone
MHNLCPICKGNKVYYPMGSIEKKCINCNGIGFIQHTLETPQAIDAKTRIKSALNSQLTRKL